MLELNLVTSCLELIVIDNSYSNSEVTNSPKSSSGGLGLLLSLELEYGDQFLIPDMWRQGWTPKRCNVTESEEANSKYLDRHVSE